MSEQQYRIEHDTMGEVKVPVDALWRAQTQRAVENFPISHRPLERTQIRAMGLLKAACAQVNKDLGLLDATKADAIIAAAKEIADGKHDDQFPIDVFQTGSGTSSNMNANEVIASIAKANGVEVHPNDDVNMSQSSNDTFPTATHVAATEAVVTDLIPALDHLRLALLAKAEEWREVVKSGRTHLMDAVPVTLGQEFPIDVFQTGSGTSSNMNANEVIASIAKANGVEVHPNDDVNMSQSSNDTFPTATHVAATEAVVTDLIPALDHLRLALLAKAEEWREVVKSGRTHLMDAVPVTLGQEFSGYTRAVEAGIERLVATLPRVGEVPIGGTAVGTGLNAPDHFGTKVVEELVRLTDVDSITLAKNNFEAQAARDGLVELSGQLKTIAVSLTKIANDVRWMGSGPLTGLAEIHLPDLQPGSSIMPGKVNPVLPEAVTQVAAQVIGNDAAVTWGGGNGAFELNVYIPMMARNVLESLKLLANVSRLFADRCISGLKADEDRLRTLAESSPSIVTPLNSAIGYEEAAAVAKQALKEKKTIRQTVLDRGLVPDKLSEEELDKRLDVLKMANLDHKR